MFSRNDPVPLFHQVAAEIRRQIDAGELQPGDALTPLRKAAEDWGIHLHTLRHAYAALAREGLIEIRRGPHGTRVAPGAGRREAGRKGLDHFVNGLLDEAERRWSLDADGLVAEIRDRERPEERATVYVVECSEHQCVSHALELGKEWEVDARPWPLHQSDGPPPGYIVATYFHYNDIRRRWPHLLKQVHFVSIAPDPDRLLLPASAARIVVCEFDAETAETVAADISRVLDRPELVIEPQVVGTDGIEPDPDAEILLIPPRVWANLPQSIRDDPRVREICYLFDRAELLALAGRLGWPPRKAAGRS